MENEWYCEYCHNWHSEDVEAFEVNSCEGLQFVCREAIGEEVARCENCNELFWIKDMKTDGETFVCGDCFDDCYERCEDCERLISRFDICYTYDLEGYVEGMFCENCIDNNAFYCDYCGCYHDNRHWHETAEDYNTICENAIESGDYSCCDGCGEYSTSVQYYSEVGECYCDDCYRKNMYIFPYHQYPSDYTVRFSEPAKRETLLHIGVELEIDGGGLDHDNARDILEDANAVYRYNYVAMMDGSLDDGFEIISQPKTLERHKQGLWEDIMEKATDYGYESHNPGTCGLHFHLDRRYFRDVKKYEEKLALLTIELEDFLKVFSRRKDFYYCRFLEFDKSKKKSLQALENYTTDNTRHTTALNFLGRDTVEMRFCRGTLKYNTFVASLELMQILADIAKFCTLDDISCLTPNAIKLIAKERGYKAIIEYMKERGL